MDCTSIDIQVKQYCKELPYDLNSIHHADTFLSKVLVERHSKLSTSLVDGMGKLFLANNNKNNKIAIPDPQKQISLIWSKYQFPMVKWFYQWKLSMEKMSKHSTKFQSFTVEFRVMIAKLSKLMKVFHKFYYGILEYIACHFDTSLVAPTQLIGNLNLEVLIQKMPHLASIRKLLQPGDNASIYIALTFYYCIIQLGEIKFHQTLLERKIIHSKKHELFFTPYNFQSAERYWNMASLLIPSMGETYRKFSKLHIHNYQYTRSLYFVIRSYFARMKMNDDEDLKYIEDFLELRKWKDLPNLRVKDTEGNIQVIEYELTSNMFEILRYFIWGECEDSKSRVNKGNNIDNTPLFKNKETVLSLLDVPMTVLENQEHISDLIVIFMGVYSITTTDIKDESYHLDPSNEQFLRFIFEVMVKILNSINYFHSTNRYHTYDIIPLLVIVRLIICWIKNDMSALRFSHRYLPICQAMCEFVQTINEVNDLSSFAYSEVRPKRTYLFEEDVQFREFKCIDYDFSDFDDNEIADMNNVTNRLSGFAPKSSQLSSDEEYNMRICAIVNSIKRFLKRNQCGISIKLPVKRKENDVVVATKTTVEEDFSSNEIIVSSQPILDSVVTQRIVKNRPQKNRNSRKLQGINVQLKQELMSSTTVSIKGSRPNHFSSSRTVSQNSINTSSTQPNSQEQSNNFSVNNLSISTVTSEEEHLNSFVQVSPSRLIKSSQ